ncbi:ABC transporter permease [Streptomyces sp. AC512_CC834]|uniref:ABC transporter permease n=1 Tax=Streptomyces sp. AC512_CC834 TaxID=2823691 RepID=UPI0020B64879|nr:FtsX-like permease family protein [Streptomyces sp. AC512_CC834]
MLRTALRNVFAHKARLLMTVLAVLLGVAFVSGTLVFTSTVSEAFQKSSQKGYADVDVSIHQSYSDTPEGSPPGPAPAPITQRTLDRATQLPGAKSAIGIVSGPAAVSDQDGKLIGDGFSNVGANYYAGEDGKGSDPRYPMKAGKAPRAPGQIALDSGTAERGGYKVGDTVRMSIEGPVHEEKVTGVFTTDNGSVAAGGSLILFDTDTAQKLFAKPGEYTEIHIAAEQGVSEEALKQQAEKILPERAEAITSEELAEDEAKAITSGMDSMKISLLAFAGIALFVGAFIIANTFTMLVAQRTKELALLRAVGASRSQVTCSVLVEAFAVGAVAGLAGLAAGIGIGAGLRSLVGTMGSVPSGPLVIEGSTVVASLAMGIIVTVLAAWLPALRASRIPPVAAMDNVHAAASPRSLVVRNTIGALLTGAGAALVLPATSMEDGMAPMGLGAVLLLIGVFVLTPLLSRHMIAAAAPVLRLFHVSGELAHQNAVRNPRRTAATASALMIGLTLITGLTVIAGGVQQAVEKLAAGSLKADYTVSMAGHTELPPQVEKKLSAMDEVTTTSPLRNATADIGGVAASLTGVNGATIGKLTAPDFQQGGWAGLSDGKKIVVDTETAKSQGWKVGSSFEMTYGDGEKGRFSVGGVYERDATLDGIVVDNSAISSHMSKVADMQVLAKTESGAGAEVKDALNKQLGDNPAILVQDKEDVAEDASQTIDVLLNMVYGLLAMAVVVAVLGVINTLAMSVFDRGQEIGMLRAIGLDRRAVKRMVRLESLVISLNSGVLGIGLGVFLGWAAGELITGLGLDTYTLVVPWGRLGIFLALAALVGVLAASWPAHRAARLDMLAAIKKE